MDFVPLTDEQRRAIDADGGSASTRIDALVSTHVDADAASTPTRVDTWAPTGCRRRRTSTPTRVDADACRRRRAIDAQPSPKPRTRSCGSTHVRSTFRMDNDK